MAIRRIDRTWRGKPTHHYEIDGVRVPGVTTLLSDGIPKPALTAWGIRTVAEYAADNLDRLNDMAPMGREAIVAALRQSPYTDRDKAAKRGSEVHALAEALAHGHAVEVPEEIRGHVESCARFLDDWNVTPTAIEITVASRRWSYCGTVDLVGDIGGVRTIADYKTSRSGIFGETALQLAAYRHAEVWLDGEAERPVADLAIERALAVHLRADGYDVYPLDAGDETFQLFLHAAYVARRAKAMKDLVASPIYPEAA